MSADNYVAVLHRKHETIDEYYVTDGNASMDQEDCQYVGRVVVVKDSRSEALEAAHDYAQALPVLEYGVTEGEYPDFEPCGRCYVCVNERKIVADDIERCDFCKEPFTNSDWVVSTIEGQFHNRCKPGRRG